MTKAQKSLTSVANRPSRMPARVRVRLQRVNANLTKVYPPDGESKVWWTRLKQALGTKSSDFVNASPPSSITRWGSRSPHRRCGVRINSQGSIRNAWTSRPSTVALAETAARSIEPR
jgi:hypothetical protein